MPDRYSPEKIEPLIALLTEIQNHALAFEQLFSDAIFRISPSNRSSARNLLHYLGLRQHDIRDLQKDLSSLGLSSLGRCESHTMAMIDAVIRVLHLLINRTPNPSSKITVPVDMASGPAMLMRNTEILLGPPRPERFTRIMVTMPSEAATDYHLVHTLLEAGMDVMRINGAHDDEDAWKGMISNLNQAKKECGLPCRVLIDLCGPKLRTGSIGSGVSVLHWRPVRDMRGRVVDPAQIWITSIENAVPAPEEADAAFALGDGLLQMAEPGDQLRFRDVRDKKRTLHITEKNQTSFWAECMDSAYIESGQHIQLIKQRKMVCESQVGQLPVVSETIVLQMNDRLFLTRGPGNPGVRHPDGTWQTPPRIPCTLPEVFADIKPGQHILFDDNAIAGIICQATADELEIEITRAKPGGAKLGADKGINLPDSQLNLPALSENDLANLDFAIAHADMVGLSFLRQAEDVKTLIHNLAIRNGEHLSILLKIENRLAFENLGEILLTGLTSPPLGVMVARGDLAAELGFERLAEVQEEILWLCEAAHVPVIWATQVLEQLSKKGMPSRAEVTDAAMGVRAECVMLNKGPYVVETVRFLDDVLKRMQRHQWKKRAMLRQLSISHIGPRTVS